MTRKPKQFCKYGHDVTVVGRYPSGRCKACSANSAHTSYQHMKLEHRFHYGKLGRSPGLGKWRETLGLSLKELSIECGLITRKNAEVGWTPRVSVEQLAELEDGGEAEAGIRLLIAQTLWRIEQRTREEEPDQPRRLREAGVV